MSTRKKNEKVVEPSAEEMELRAELSHALDRNDRLVAELNKLRTAQEGQIAAHVRSATTESFTAILSVLDTQALHFVCRVLEVGERANASVTWMKQKAWEAKHANAARRVT